MIKNLAHRPDLLTEVVRTASCYIRGMLQHSSLLLMYSLHCCRLRQSSPYFPHCRMLFTSAPVQYACRNRMMPQSKSACEGRNARSVLCLLADLVIDQQYLPMLLHVWSVTAAAYGLQGRLCWHVL